MRIEISATQGKAVSQPKKGNIKYQLTISPDYVSHWKLWEAVRELLQNAIDQRRRDDTCELLFEHDSALSILTVGNTGGPALTPKSLLLGLSDKREDKNLIGQIGRAHV